MTITTMRARTTREVSGRQETVARPAEAVGLRTDWAPLGNCVSQDPDALFVRGAAQQDAKVVCQRCPVVAECLADALDNRTEFGVWGGMTERERRAMLRRHPRVSSWRNLFQTALLTQSQVS